MQRLGMAGSTERALIWKQAVTPAGLPLSRLAVSMRLTKEIGFGLWPTPQARDWKRPQAKRFLDPARSNDLPDAVADAVATVRYWVTPTATDGNRGVKPPRPHDTGVPLSQQVFGMERLTWSAEMVENGVLNPAFVSWLMGYPPQWLDCAPSAMP